MLPYDYEDEELDTTQEEETPVLYEYGIDFTTGQPTGEKVYGSEAVKVWAWNALNTMRYKYMIYSDSYGSDLDTLIGMKISRITAQSLAKHMVEECLLVNPEIKSVSNFSCDLSKGTGTISCTVNTIYGEEELNV